MSNLLGVAAAIQTQADSLQTHAQSFALQRALWWLINYLRKMWLRRVDADGVPLERTTSRSSLCRMDGEEEGALLEVGAWVPGDTFSPGLMRV